jgi:hypothetical protein
MISHNSKAFKYPDYISPLPSDEYIKYAEKKQTMYDEGLSQVKQTVDNYASLRQNILTETERDYYDKAMTNLVQGINKNAGVDFSYKGNVSAVLGMGKTLERDNNIITAIGNGKEVQRRQEALSKLDGSKRSAANDHLYMKDVQDYLKSNKLGEKLSYGKSYEEYYDISKDWKDFWGTIKGSNQSEVINTQSKYGPAYMEKVTTEGFSKSEIAQKFEAYLGNNPKALRQLNIDVAYNLDSLGKENAFTGYVQNMRQTADAASSTVNKLNTAIAELEQSYAKTKSPIIKEQVDQYKSMRDYQNQVRVMASQKSETPFEEFDINDYSGIYKSEFISNMSNMYAGQKVSRDLIKNEYWVQQKEDNRILMRHNLAMQRDKTKLQLEVQDRYITTKKDLELDVPQMTAVIKNVPHAINQLDAVIGKAVNQMGIPKNSGAAMNMERAQKALRAAEGLNGVAQLNKIKEAMTYLGPSKINARLKQDIASIFGLSNVNTAAEYDDFINQVTQQLTTTSTMLANEVAKGKQPGVLGEMARSRQISYNDAFDYSISSIENMNFILNGNSLTGRLAIASPESSGYSREETVKVPRLDAQGKVMPGEDGKPIMDEKTITVTNKATNRVNKGEKYKISASTESDDNN